METEKTNGALIGLVVIIIILVIGGIYIWQSGPKESPVTPGNESGTTVTSQDSASLDALDKDVNSADTNAGVDSSTVN